MHSTTTSGFAALIVFLASSGYLHLEPAADAGDLAEIPSDLRGIDVDGADDLESLTRGDLPHDAGANGPEAEMHDPDGPLLCWHLMLSSMTKIEEK